MLSASGVLHSSTEGKMCIWPRLAFFFVAQSVATEFFVSAFLQVGRWLQGEASASWGPVSGELAVHNPTIPWPSMEYLPADLHKFASKNGQPFFLNKVTGKRRSKDALMRIGMNVGSFFTVGFMCMTLDGRSLASLGLTCDKPFFIDMFVGLGIGIFIVSMTFLVELLFGWIRFMRLFEVFDRSDRFITCFFWDVVFHLNVSLNEELPVRGWMLYNIAEAVNAYFGLHPTTSFLLATLAQSLFFVVMHMPSPGGKRPQSMINIFVGGMSGGLNVLFTGGRLGFALGWHFGWNISMGNVFGMSTSGIPISATVFSIAPHPEKEHLHGGVFGPEGGVVSPCAYLLGVVMMLAYYGIPEGGVGGAWLAASSVGS
eukprot:TRINITY_DN49780_c0_g1_i1.p1 TRINITY_DN49780_c0_g1~~TRINITY_DN49780_c0_g1_i1.p1  ORF type:complete len:429 (-),score=87.06 TRINITY_DN49780_c0_g1_i1:50-1162(-)